EPILDPLDAFRGSDVHIFHTDGVAVNALQMAHDRFERGRPYAQYLSGVENGLQVVLRQPKVDNVQGGLVFSSVPDRIGLREQVPSRSVTIDQTDDLELLLKGLGHFHLFSVGQDDHSVFFGFYPQIFQRTFQSKVKTLKKSPPTGL